MGGLEEDREGSVEEDPNFCSIVESTIECHKVLVEFNLSDN